jgi:hypothetical protein
MLGEGLKNEPVRQVVYKVAARWLTADPPSGSRRNGDRQLFLLLGLWPAGGLPDVNGFGSALLFLRFLSAFGFFFSLLLRI